MPNLAPHLLKIFSAVYATPCGHTHLLSKLVEHTSADGSRVRAEDVLLSFL